MQRSGISLDAITDELVDDGVQLFADAADKLYGALAEKRAKFLGGKLLSVDLSLGEAEEAVTAEIKRRTTSGDSRRLWAKDKSLWTGADEDKWLGWLDIAAREAADGETYRVPALDPRQRVQRCGAARHGRIQPRRRGAEPGLRRASRLAQAACARFHRSGADRRGGGRDRISARRLSSSPPNPARRSSPIS